MGHNAKRRPKSANTPSKTEVNEMEQRGLQGPWRSNKTDSDSSSTCLGEGCFRTVSAWTLIAFFGVIVPHLPSVSLDTVHFLWCQIGHCSLHDFHRLEGTIPPVQNEVGMFVLELVTAMCKSH